MTSTYLIRIRNFILVAIIQVLIFSQIHLFGYATACVYLLFILKMPRLTSRNELLVWAFLLGLTVDIFSNTPGLNAAAATAMAFARNMVLSSFLQKVTSDNFVPSVRTLNWGGYICYTLICILLFYFLLFLLEMFTVGYPLQLIISISSSTLLTMLFVLVIEFFTRN